MTAAGSKVRALSRTMIAGITRKKSAELPADDAHTLKRCLGIVDVIAFGLGCCVGSGAYVTCGKIALNHAGPSAFLSFLFAAGAALLAGLCFAELASRMPIAGGAYACALNCFPVSMPFSTLCPGRRHVLNSRRTSRLVGWLESCPSIFNFSWLCWSRLGRHSLQTSGTVRRHPAEILTANYL
jgi:amino acid transporter